MDFLPESIPSKIWGKSTNFLAKNLKDEIFKSMEQGPVRGRIVSTKVEVLSNEFTVSYVETAYMIVKRYLAILGFKNVVYVRKDECYIAKFYLAFTYDKGRRVTLDQQIKPLSTDHFPLKSKKELW